MDWEWIHSDCGGYVMCDGILIENVHHINIDYDENKIVLTDDNHKVIGSIFDVKSRRECVFGKKVKSTDYYDDVYIIFNGQIVKNRK